MQRKKQTPPDTPEEEWERQLHAYSIAACILDLILIRGNLNGFGGFIVDEGFIRPACGKQRWDELSPSERQELTIQIEESFSIGKLVGVGLINQEMILDKILANEPDSHKVFRINRLLKLCQTTYRNFANRVMSHWDKYHFISDVDIMRYFIEDGGVLN